MHKANTYGASDVDFWLYYYNMRVRVKFHAAAVLAALAYIVLDQNIVVCQWSSKQLQSVSVYIRLSVRFVVSLQERAVALRAQTPYAILVMDYVNARGYAIETDRQSSSVRARSLSKQADEERNMTCLLPLRWIAIYSAVLVLSHHMDAMQEPMQRRIYGLPGAYVSLLHRRWDENERRKKIIPLGGRVKQPNRMCPINCIANATKYRGRRRRQSDRSHSTEHTAHASFLRSFSDSADFFIAINGEEKKFQKCDVTKLQRLKGRAHARISCAFMTKMIIIMIRKTSFDFGVASCCCGRQIAVCFRSHCVCGTISRWQKLNVIEMANRSTLTDADDADVKETLQRRHKI